MITPSIFINNLVACNFKSISILSIISPHISNLPFAPQVPTLNHKLLKLIQVPNSKNVTICNNFDFDFTISPASNQTINIIWSLHAKQTIAYKIHMCIKVLINYLVCSIPKQGVMVKSSLMMVALSWWNDERGNGNG